MSHPLVVNLKSGQEYDVYIGRPQKNQDPAECPWGNPFEVRVYGRDKCIEMYKEWFPKQAHLMARLPELKGKRLGCFCTPNNCHGDFLAQLANG